VHAAIDNLGQRLARRMAHERAFASHAAHALRTPLAGMDAQLAVALRESTPALQQRLQRVREASGRLQRVVRSMLDLFRAGGEVRRQAIDLHSLLAHLPVEHLQVAVDAGTPLHADPDLLAAALANLLDNAQRYGATRVTVSLPAPGTLRVHNDGPGLSAERREQLRSALSSQNYEHHAGLGLMLADLVARAHGGALALPETASGFAVDLKLEPSGHAN
jgi:two-component system OmpR family sensor kinase